MELSLTNHILNGVFQPWQNANQSERYFADLLSQGSRKLPQNTSELNTTLQKLLRDYKDLFHTIQFDVHEELLQPLFKDIIPAPENSTTEFYLLLVQLDALQYLMRLHKAVEEAEDDNEKYYLINAALQKVKYQVVASDELHNQLINNHLLQETNTSNDVIKNTVFILEIVQKVITALFYEIQTRFESFVKVLEPEFQFNRDVLKHSEPVTLSPTYHFFVWRVEQLINNNETSVSVIRKLYSEISVFGIDHNCDVTELLTGFENYICSSLYDIDDTENTLSVYSLPETTEYIFNEAKKSVEESFTRSLKGYERLEIIKSFESKMIIQVLPSSRSAIGKLSAWFESQKYLYTNTLTITFEAEKVVEAKKATSKASTKLSFGFHKDPKVLKKVIVELTSSINFLDESQNTTEDLLKLLTNKNITPESVQIHLNCETVQFAYIVTKLQSVFSNLTRKAIEKSKSFYSKKGKLITSQNLYSSNISNPKDQENIDNIINQLQ